MPPQTVSQSSSRFSFERASIWAVVATLVVAVVAFIPSNSIPFLATKTFVLAIGSVLTLACFILARLTRGNIILPPLPLLGALWLPAVAYGLSALFSGVGFANGVFGGALEPDTFGFMLVAVLLGTLAALAIRRPESYQAFFKILGYLFGVLVAIQVLILILGQFMPETLSPSFSIVGSSDDLGILLGLGVVLTLFSLRLGALSKRARIYALVVGAVALFLLALLNSSFIWGLVALGAFGFFVEAVMKRTPVSPEADFETMEELPLAREAGSEDGNRALVVPLVTLVVALFFFFGSTLGNALANTFHIQILSVRPSFNATLGVGSKVYGTSALFGSGPNTFQTEWTLYRDATLNQTPFWNVDFPSGVGFIPTSFITTGIVGALAWIVFLGMLLFFGGRAVLLRAPEDRTVRLSAVLSFIGACYLFAATIFTVPNAVVLAFAFVFAGVFISTTRFAQGGAQWGISFARSPRVGFVIVFLLTLVLLASIAGAYTLIERYLAQVNITHASALVNAGDLDGAANAVNSSIAFAPSEAAYQAQAQIAQIRLQQIVSSTTLPASVAQSQFQNTLSAGINAALTATRLAPNDYQNWIILGNLYGTVVPLNVQGAYDSAKSAYEKASALNPTNPTILYSLAQLAAAHKDTAGAISYLEKAISVKQDYTAAIFMLSQLEVASGNLKDALAAAEAAAYFTPNDANILFQLGLLRAANHNTDGAIQALSAAVTVNPQFANARYFLAAVYAKKGDSQDALTQLQAISDLSADNAKAVEGLITSVKGGKDPFPANLLSASSTPL